MRASLASEPFGLLFPGKGAQGGALIVLTVSPAGAIQKGWHHPDVKWAVTASGSDRAN